MRKFILNTMKLVLLILIAAFAAGWTGLGRVECRCRGGRDELQESIYGLVGWVDSGCCLGIT